jgi:nicotinamide-nucleotide amidase
MKIDQNTDIQKLDSSLKTEVEKAALLLRDKKLTVGFAESCTGGLLSSSFTELAGISDVFMGSVVCYDNSIKQKFLKISAEALKNFGAVSSDVAKQMAEGAHKELNVKVAVAITGIAGPGGGTAAKPVGTVFVAVAGFENEVKVFEHHFDGNRKAIQLQSAIEAIKHLNEFINKK